ncbi:MAG: N-acetylmuramoyl-L-alanine amidase [Leptolyngbyaceae cyanobacterium RM1_406_9]|nr:N-acetylmuramoyl-L-alanine amidase [Leptolyngbyaceae cyanobacterium RM1_406_9]
MQAGLFREQGTAANLQQSLNRQNLQASIMPVSEASVNLPRTPPSGSSSGQVPRERIVVVIDPGHGGRDPGAIGIGGLREKDVVLSISRQVADLLEREGIQVVMTRADDRALELSTRVQMAQRANANYFVSIHANALNMSRPDVNGVETFYHRSGRELAQSIQNSIMQSVNMNNRGVKQANFYVLRNTSMPSVLVEVGFVTGRDDAAKLRDAGFQTTMAGAIARGIVQNVRSR